MMVLMPVHCWKKVLAAAKTSCGLYLRDMIVFQGFWTCITAPGWQHWLPYALPIEVCPVSSKPPKMVCSTMQTGTSRDITLLATSQASQMSLNSSSTSRVPLMSCRTYIHTLTIEDSHAYQCNNICISSQSQPMWHAAWRSKCRQPAPKMHEAGRHTVE